MEKGKKRIPIQKRIQKVVLTLAAVALLITMGVGITNMLLIRRDVINVGNELGKKTGDASTKALNKQVKQNMLDTVSDKASFANAKFDKFASYANTMAGYINNLYTNSAQYNALEITQPTSANKGKLVMQRGLANKSISYASLAYEAALLGNIKPLLSNIVGLNPNVVASAYLGTTSGLLYSYDAYSQDGDPDTGEFYYDYFNTEWYKQGIKSKKASFTDTYQDAFGMGLVVTCVSPFYKADGSFGGVIGIDILLTDLNKHIIDVNLGSGSYAFLVSREGDIIASPDIKADDTKLKNIKDDDSKYKDVAKQFMSGKTAFVKGSDNVYYAYAPISSSELTLVVSVPSSLVTKQVDTLRNAINKSTALTEKKTDQLILNAIISFVAIFIVIIGIVIYLSRRFTRRLTEPLLALKDDASQISSGNLDHVAKVFDDDEIGDLAVTFNSMTANLRHYIADLTNITAEKERIGAELNVAAHIQESMLPCIFPAFPERPEFDIYAKMAPAKEVGGDFYDFFLIDDDRLAIVMADVSGKGVPAALFMVIAKTLIKNAAQTGLPPHAVLEKVNQQLCENNEEDMFVTVWLGILEISTGRLAAANAGHEYPALKRHNQQFELYQDKHGFVVGGIDSSRYREYELQLEPGDTLFLYTDGVTEATNSANELYGTDRLINALNDKEVYGKELLTNVKRDIDAFVGEAPQFDDITMLSIKIKETDGTMKKIKVKPTSDTTNEVTAFVEDELTALEVPFKTISQINIAIDEIFSNIVLYSKASYATVGVEAQVGVITLRFADNGLKYNPIAQADPNVKLSAEEREIGGLGIFMVKKLMDEVDYEYKDGLNILMLKKRYS